MKQNEHVPVMLNEAVNALHIKNGKTYIDATLGAGGHSSEILNQGGKVLAIEADSEMIKFAKEKLIQACPGMNQDVHTLYFKIVNDNFSNIVEIAVTSNFGPYYGVLMDLGISNIHLTSNKRGFSFKNLDDPLDMRLDPENNQVTAAALLNALREDQLIKLFSEYLTLGESMRLSENIIEFRSKKLFESVSDFVEVCKKSGIRGKVDAATKPFMALRIAVNSEYENLTNGLEGAIEVLSSKGRIVVISFHSGEDRIVKNKFNQFEKKDMGKVITKSPVLPSEDEILKNPKSRSAKLRVFEKN